jgi:UDP-N-acetylglucosamine/UDP-N-acetyl-alpha-D-glucosaminouronate 4-epimerase
MARYLVTGGAGFIGSNTVDELLRRGEKVRVLDNLTTGRVENLADARDHIEFFHADICRREEIQPHFDGVDYVIHLAALPSVARSVAEPVVANAVNIDGTLNVLVAARDAKVQRLVFAGSAAVYGDNPELPRVETQKPQPLSPYALHKLAGELYAKIFYRVYGLETVTVRYFNVFGPRQNPKSEYTGVLSLFIAAYLQNGTPTIFGDGEQSRDFIFVENVVAATLRACTAKDAAGQAINVGTGERHTLNETIEILNRIFGRKIEPHHGPPRKGDVRHSHADITLARQLLEYEPKIGFETGLGKTAEWIRSQLDAGPQRGNAEES